jgi:hypothetical protein
MARVCDNSIILIWKWSVLKDRNGLLRRDRRKRFFFQLPVFYLDPHQQLHPFRVVVGLHVFVWPVGTSAAMSSFQSGSVGFSTSVNERHLTKANHPKGWGAKPPA